MRFIVTTLISLIMCVQLGGVLAWAEMSQTKNPSWRTVVIDPGHGGEDFGVKGISGTPEKEITLKIATQLAQLLTRRLGVRTILTRNKDTSLAWDNRVAIANNNKADLFVSLHANADLANRAKGMAVYVITEQNWPSAIPTAPDTATELIQWDFVQKDYWQNSLAVAQAIHTQALQHSEVESRGVFAAPLLSLKGASMPAVLIELGFLTTPQEEENLVNQDYQKLLVKIILEGILDFKRNENSSEQGFNTN